MFLDYLKGNFMITDIQKYLSQFYQGTKNPNLETMKYFTKKLNHPEDEFKIIHIAGTNGKGSVTEMVCRVLIEQGYTVGKYMSPHLIKFNERICVNNVQISDEELLEFINKKEPLINDCNLHFGKPPTFFEITTTLALWYFKIKKCDFVVLETGLGGTYDCTNIVNPVVSIINSISYDHMSILGNTLPEIAENKAGIIKPNSNTVYMSQEKEVDDVIKKHCMSQNNSLHLLKQDDITNYSYTQEYQTFTYKNYKNIDINLKGIKQVKNATLTLECMNILSDLGYKLEEEKTRKALRNVVHKGRFEQISTNPTIIYDGGHNEEAIKNFKHSVEMYYKDAKKVYLICSLKSKDHKTILKELLEDINATFIVHDGIKSSEGKTLNFTSKEVLYDEALNINKNANVLKMDLLDSLKYVEQNFKDRVVFIIGSFYIYGAVADYLANLKV